jgi:hypothetical protein
MYEVDLDAISGLGGEKPWTKPGADISGKKK